MLYLRVFWQLLKQLRPCLLFCIFFSSYFVMYLEPSTCLSETVVFNRRWRGQVDKLQKRGQSRENQAPSCVAVHQQSYSTDTINSRNLTSNCWRLTLLMSSPWRFFFTIPFSFSWSAYPCQRKKRTQAGTRSWGGGADTIQGYTTSFR